MIFLIIILIAAYFVVPVWIAVWLINKYNIDFDIMLTAWIIVLIEFAGACQFIYWAETC
jgi:hypothetical protein